jgi:hypothetical protein
MRERNLLPTATKMRQWMLPGGTTVRERDLLLAAAGMR